MAKSPHCTFAQCLAASAVLLVVGGLPMFGQPYSLPVQFGKIDVELTLNLSGQVASWFTIAEEVSQGGIFLSVAPITVRSPVYLTPYDLNCPLSPTPQQRQYLYNNTLPLVASASPSYPQAGSPSKGATYTILPPASPSAYPLYPFPYGVDLQVALNGGRKHYVAKSIATDPIFPFDQNTGLPVYTRILGEDVGALHVRLLCTDLSIANATPGDNPYITATLLSPINDPPDVCSFPYLNLQTATPAVIPGQLNTLQASVSSASTPPPTIDETFLVRGTIPGQTYQVTVRFSSGSSYGAINGVSQATSAPVTPGQIVDVDCVVPDPTFCDLAPMPCRAGWGRLAMLGNSVGTLSVNGPANICLPGLPAVALIFDPIPGNPNAPYGNSRVGLLDPWNEPPPPGYFPPPTVPQVSGYTYTTANPPGYYPPSSFNFPNDTISFPCFYQFGTIIAGNYVPQARVYFQPNHFGALSEPHRFEHFESPIRLPSQFIGCPDNVDLGDLLIMSPGFVTGRIHLEGANCGQGTTCLQWIKAGNDPGDELTVANASQFWRFDSGGKHTSYVSATAGSSAVTVSGGGNAFSDILITSSTPTALDANYEYWLAGLNNGENSSWQCGNLTLLLRDPANPALPDCTLTINDRLAAGGAPGAPLTVVPGTEYFNDLDHCLGHVELTLVNVDHHLIADP